MKEVRFLQDDADLTAKPLQIQIPDILAVDKDMALFDIVEAGDQVYQRAFSRATGSHQADHFSGLDGEGDIVQSVFAGRIGKAHMVEIHLALHGSEADTGIEDGFGIRVHDFEYAFGRGQTALQPVIHAAEFAHGGVEPVEVTGKGHQGSHGGGILHDHVAADAEDQNRAEGCLQGQKGKESGKEFGRSHFLGEKLEAAVAEAFGFPNFLSECLDHADPRYGVGQDGVQSRGTPPDAVKQHVNLVSENQGADHDDRCRGQGQEKKLPVHHQKNAGNQQHGGDADDNLLDAIGDELLQAAQIAGDPRHDSPGFPLGVESQA